MARIARRFRKPAARIIPSIAGRIPIGIFPSYRRSAKAPTANAATGRISKGCPNVQKKLRQPQQKREEAGKSQRRAVLIDFVARLGPHSRDYFDRFSRHSAVWIKRGEKCREDAGPGTHRAHPYRAFWYARAAGMVWRFQDISLQAVFPSPARQMSGCPGHRVRRLPRLVLVGHRAAADSLRPANPLGGSSRCTWGRVLLAEPR